MIGGFEEPDEGVIYLGDRPVTRQDRIASVLGEVLSEAWAELEKGRGKALAQA